MFTTWKSAAATAIPALALVATPVQARDGYGRGHGSDDAAIAIGAGVVGLALGAALASGNRDRDYYYEDDDAYPRGSYYPAYPRNYSYRYDYPRYERHWNGWRGDRLDGWGHRGGWGDRGGWGHGPRRWGY